MTDRTPDHGNAPDRADATVRLDRRLTETITASEPPRGTAEGEPAAAPTTPPEPGPTGERAGAGTPPTAVAPTRDDRTVDLRKGDPRTSDPRQDELSRRETETVRVDQLPLSPWAPGGVGAPYPATPPSGPPPGGAWSAQQPPSSWSEPPPSWSAGPTPPSPWSAAQTPPPWGSTRAMPQPPVTPPLPPPRGRGPAALIVFGVLAALVIAGGAWALISLAAGASPFGPRADDPRADAPPTADAPTFPLPPTVDPTDPLDPDDIAPSGGPTGQVVVSWSIESTAYQATLTTAGPTGTAVVTYTDPDDGVQRTVRQDVRLAGDGGQLAYVGSNPVDADTGAPSTDYAPDIFLLTTNDEGKVSINQVCDTTGICSPATME